MNATTTCWSVSRTVQRYEWDKAIRNPTIRYACEWKAGGGHVICGCVEAWLCRRSIASVAWTSSAACRTTTECPSASTCCRSCSTARAATRRRPSPTGRPQTSTSISRVSTGIATTRRVAPPTAIRSKTRCRSTTLDTHGLPSFRCHVMALSSIICNDNHTRRRKNHITRVDKVQWFPISQEPPTFSALETPELKVQGGPKLDCF